MELWDNYSRKIDYLRLSITDRCNLRCIYCRPGLIKAQQERKDLLTYEEILRLVRCAVEVGISKIRLTGGEPLIRRDIVDLIRAIICIPGVRDLSLTTNGILLPYYIDGLVAAGLKRINISLDTLDPQLFRTMTGGRLEDALKGLRWAQERGLNPIKINVVVLAGINDDLEPFARLSMEEEVYIRFIGYMPLESTNLATGDSMRGLSYQEMLEKLSSCGSLRPTANPEGAGPATYFRYQGARGIIGLICSESNCFCQSCNRLRVTSDGKLKTCLFGSEELDLKNYLRDGSTDEQLKGFLISSLARKPQKRSQKFLSRDMSEVGG
ncbi:GTP 3',8-cyclase [Candidatus Hakubella thermalkaliphila]|uniref:GTP 3',8-cyclase n=2 Tax=Candidatus Hakubella thermalkaliphila TaxID=2754717 RepID=A0A6V8QB35_9ACTN|nr:GTP 3',8-cyclase MoaA [Candidatus Hakubella thermalkaliphila]GFP30103.1 GTP 3',8-cyclase [Candidatus Hakubella thermalkaliphila]GFP36674.1 GTP 3',8-cyclase [Candidatus Hakubella thermalkaliphila]GFP41244.1 GTP 3',8-cyclase [Candidatus Hakubella thermalkaliphila]